MFGQGTFKEEDGMLREIIRSIDKKLDYTVRPGGEKEQSSLTLQLSLRTRQATVTLSLDDLKAAKSDLVKKHQIRQKIKARRDHMDDSHFMSDVLGTKAAKLLRGSTKPEPPPQRGFGRAPRR